MTVVAGLGLWTRVLYMVSIGARTLKMVKWGHRILGYVVVILCKANYYIMLKPAQLSLFIWIDAVMIPLFVFRRLWFPKMGSWWKISPKYKQTFRTIRSLKELDQRKDYLVFANYVYDAYPLKNTHPGGAEVLDAISNREVDRFIYGVTGADEYP